MTKKRPEQKLISFTENDAELTKVRLDIQDGWNIISLIPSGGYYVGIMEKTSASSSSKNNDGIYIPPRKKIKLIG